MSDEILAAILTKVSTVAEDMASVKAQVESLVGNGQPGRIDKVEADVDSLKAAKNYLWGFGAGLVFLEGAFHYVLHKMGMK
jgi:hypothetical protein